jgi:hypothetical protein
MKARSQSVVRCFGAYVVAREEMNRFLRTCKGAAVDDVCEAANRRQVAAFEALARAPTRTAADSALKARAWLLELRSNDGEIHRPMVTMIRQLAGAGARRSTSARP